VRIQPHQFSGTVRVPASKSHTIRQLLIASLADGVSEIQYPLDSLDARSCVNACRVFGAEVTEIRADNDCPNPADENGKKLTAWRITGNNNFKKQNSSHNRCVDVGNSGTTLYLAIAIAGLQNEWIEFTGDEQIKKRSAKPLLDALSGLGVETSSNSGCVPVTVKGPWRGGKTSISCPTSQYLSALLIAAPLADSGIISEIEVPLLYEKPYIKMTLSYLNEQNIPYTITPDIDTDSWQGHLVIPGGASWKPFSRPVPGDFSSAAFPACAAAVSGGSVTLLGLDPLDTQGDKFFFDMLNQMGCDISWINSASGKAVKVSRKTALHGGIFDLNATPDLLPAAAVTAAFADGDTTLTNIAHARIKETDRIAVMAKELAVLGVKCTELDDGLVIHSDGGRFKQQEKTIINGHGDHRIVMAFTAAALGCKYPIEITSAESASVTYPGFLELLSPEFFRD
jgi:3-phosphoshikimate 1-carboxyvinyltransferase